MSRYLHWSTAWSCSLLVLAGCGAGTSARTSNANMTSRADATLNVTPASRWQDGHWFAARAREALDQLGARVRSDVEQGFLTPDALQDHRERRLEVEASLARTTSDGWTTQSERDWVRQRMEDAERAPRRFARTKHDNNGDPVDYRYDDHWWR